jgi:hypothetical protein
MMAQKQDQAASSSTTRIIAVKLARKFITDGSSPYLSRLLPTSLLWRSMSVVGHKSFGPLSCNVVERMLNPNFLLSSLNSSMSDITHDTMPIIAKGLACNEMLHFVEHLGQQRAVPVSGTIHLLATALP